MKAFLLSIGACLVGLVALLSFFGKRLGTFFSRKEEPRTLPVTSNHEAGEARRAARKERIEAIKREREETVKCEAERARKEILEKFGPPE